MNIEQLIEIVRDDYFDDPKSSGNLWSEKFFLRSFLEAERQACNRTDFLYEDNYPYYTQIKLTDGKASYDLSQKITSIEHAEIGGTAITHKSKDELDRTTPAWRSEMGIKNKTVYFLIRGRKIRIYPTPTASLDATFIQSSAPASGMVANDTWWDSTNSLLYLYTGGNWVATPNATLATLNLEVYRLPDADVITTSYEPEIPEENHRDLIYWVLHEGYKKQDADMYNQERSDYFLGRFEKIFGPYVPAAVRLNQLQEDKSLILRPIAYSTKLTSSIDEDW